MSNNKPIAKKYKRLTMKTRKYNGKTFYTLESYLNAGDNTLKISIVCDSNGRPLLSPSEKGGKKQFYYEAAMFEGRREDRVDL